MHWHVPNEVCSEFYPSKVPPIPKSSTARSCQGWATSPTARTDACTACPSLCAKALRQLVNGLMHGAAVPNDVGVSAYELLERRVEIVKIKVGNEAIYAGIDAGG